MSDHGQASPSAETIEDVLRAELAHGDAVVATTGPVLHHLLVNDDQTLFSDQTIARVRGMVTDIARQLLFAVAEEIESPMKPAFVEAHANDLAASLLGDASFLAHAHTLTIEAQIAERLSQRSGVDPVLSPLLQELAASSDADIAASAMRTLASQARFFQQQRRMSLPLSELPQRLFDLALSVLRIQLAEEHAEGLENVEARLREEYNPSARREQQIAWLINAMQHDATRAIDVDHSGVGIFASALAMASGQSRGAVILSLGEKQCARLALSLLTAGMKNSEVEEQFLFLHPEINLPEGFDALTKEQASAMLAGAQSGQTH